MYNVASVSSMPNQMAKILLKSGMVDAIKMDKCRNSDFSKLLPSNKCNFFQDIYNNLKWTSPVVSDFFTST